MIALPLTSLITTTVAHLGELGVFLLMVPESACIPVASEVTLLFTGFAVSRGWIDPWGAIGAATAGNVVGSTIAYAIGRTGRVTLPGRVSCSRLFARHGDAAVFIARVLPLARSFVSLPAGQARVPPERFVALTAAGCLIWCAALIGLGVVVGASWEAVSSMLGRLTALAAGVLVVAWGARTVAARARIG